MFSISKPWYRSATDVTFQESYPYTMYVRSFVEKVETFRIHEKCDKYKEDFVATFGTYPPPCEYCLMNQDCKKLIHKIHPVSRPQSEVK